METGFMNRIIGLVLALVVGGLLVGGLLIPSIEAIQTNVGDEITLKNNSDIVLKSIDDGDVFKLTSTRNADSSKTDVWTINDKVITNVSGSSLSWNVGLISDAMYIRIISSGNASSGATTLMDSTTGVEQYIGPATTEGVYTWTWEFVNGTMTYIDRYGTVVTAPYTWGYVVCPLEDGEYYSAETDGAGICKDTKDLILCGGYTSGTLDTMYALHNGQTYTSVSDYTMTVNTTTALHDGTTDIYDITVTVDISGEGITETFTPYRIYLPYEVTGHETSGMYYVMFGVISILGIVALVVVAANGIRNKY